MANTFTVTNPQIFGQPIINGQNSLTAQSSLSQSAVTHTGWDISSTNLVSLQFVKFGTPTADCTATLQISIDGGTNYRDFKSYTNAQITTTGGIVVTEQVKGTHARINLVPGTMTGANGFNVRALI